MKSKNKAEVRRLIAEVEATLHPNGDTVKTMLALIRLMKGLLEFYK